MRSRRRARRIRQGLHRVRPRPPRRVIYDVWKTEVVESDGTCCGCMFKRCAECDPVKKVNLRCAERRLDDEDGGFVECEDMVLNITDVELENAEWPSGGTLEIDKLQDGTYLLFLWYPPRFMAEQAERGVRCPTFSLHGTLPQIVANLPDLMALHVCEGFVYERPFPQVKESDFLTRAELLDRIRAEPDGFFMRFGRVERP